MTERLDGLKIRDGFRRIALGLTACGLAVSSLMACTVYGYPGSGVLRSEIRDVPPFTSLGVHDNFEFTFTENKQRGRHDVKLTIDDNLSRFITTQVVNGRLDVHVTGTLAPRRLLLEINGPALQGFVVDTRARGTADSLTNFSQLSFDFNTGGQMTVAHLEGENVNVRMSGGGLLNLQDGTVSSLLLNSLTANSRVNAENLKAGRVDATLAGASWAQVYPATRLNALSLTEGSTLFYKGNPQINQQIINGNSRMLPYTATPGVTPSSSPSPSPSPSK